MKTKIFAICALIGSAFLFYQCEAFEDRRGQGVLNFKVDFSQLGYDCHTVTYGLTQVRIKVVNPSGTTVYDTNHDVGPYSATDEISISITGALTAAGTYWVKVYDTGGYLLDEDDVIVTTSNYENGDTEEGSVYITKSEAGC